EVLASAVSRSRKRFPGRLIRVKAPDELLMVPMDATLIEQVLINLVENALRHSPEDSPVDVEARREGGYAVFEVIDNGEGISVQDFPYLFETYVPNGKRSADAKRGMGIGLSICMTIIKAHQGTLTAFNRETGGAVFRFSLPLK
nr:ATP-binding protein [Clostridia bacterium]